MSFVDQDIALAPPRILAVVLGVPASPISMAVVCAVISWPFALGFGGLALPLCVVVGIPVALCVRTRIDPMFMSCMAVGGAAGLLTSLAIMAVAAIRDTYYEMAGVSFILILGGVMCGGIAFPWIRWFDRHLPVKGTP
jgi:hypothetical protein